MHFHKHTFTSKPHLHTNTKAPKQTLFLFFATIGTSWNAGGWVSARAIRPQNKPKPFGAMWHPEVPHNLKKDGKDDRVIAVRPSHPSWPHFLTPVKSRASEENKGFNAYIVPSEARQTSRQAQNPRTSRREKFKVTSTHPVSDSKQRGKWGHNQQVPPFTYMKAQREGRHRFKSASSNRRRGRTFFHVNEPIDQKPDASIWATMYTQWAPRGESYTMIVLRVRGHRCHLCQVLPHQRQAIRSPSWPRLPIKKSGKLLESWRWNRTLGSWISVWCQAVF